MPGMRAFGCHQTGSANHDSEFQVRNLKSFHRSIPAICWLLPATPKSAAVEPQYLIRVKSARSTEFPLRRLAVRGCKRTMSEAKETASAVRRSVREICLQIEPTKPPTGMKWRLSIFEVRISVLRLLRKSTCRQWLCGGSYCRRPGSVGGSLNGNRLDKASFVKFIGYGDGFSTALYVGPA